MSCLDEADADDRSTTLNNHTADIMQAPAPDATYGQHLSPMDGALAKPQRRLSTGPSMNQLRQRIGRTAERLEALTQLPSETRTTAAQAEAVDSFSAHAFLERAGSMSKAFYVQVQTHCERLGEDVERLAAASDELQRVKHPNVLQSLQQTHGSLLDLHRSLARSAQQLEDMVFDAYCNVGMLLMLLEESQPVFPFTFKNLDMPGEPSALIAVRNSREYQELAAFFGVRADRVARRQSRVNHLSTQVAKEIDFLDQCIQWAKSDRAMRSEKPRDRERGGLKVLASSSLKHSFTASDLESSLSSLSLSFHSDNETHPSNSDK